MNNIPKVSLEDTLYLIQMMRETALSQGQSAQAKRLATISNIDGPSLTLYESLREKRSGVAVAAVTDSSC